MPNNKPINILMVEDNEGDVELAKIAFSEANVDCVIHVVSDGQDGLHYLRQEGEFMDAKTPDIILLDINMPRMDGKEFLDAVKSDNLLRKIPVIMLTSSESPVDVGEAYHKYANSYVIKPITLDKFIEVAKQIECFWSDLSVLPKVK